MDRGWSNAPKACGCSYGKLEQNDGDLEIPELVNLTDVLFEADDQIT